MKYIYVAKSIVCRADGKFLVLKRSSTDSHAPGRVDLPGGGVEAGESYTTAAVREIAEEAGLTVSPEQLRLVYAMSRLSPRSDEVIVRFLFVAHVDVAAAVTLSYEHDAYEWCDLASLRNVFEDTSWGEAIEFLATHHIL